MTSIPPFDNLKLVFTLMSNIENKKKQALELLKIHYGFERLRHGQEKAIFNVLEGKSTLVIMPTGGGKSLCYQLPALVFDGITIVISPLIALMKDQVDSLTKVGIPAAFINSSISPSETAKRLEEVKNGFYKLLYIAPERFYSAEFTDALAVIKVSLFAIDEAHCVSQWGHDFRPSYLRLRQAIESLGNPVVLALTATATPEVKEDIAKQLGLEKPESVITGFARRNLQLGIIHASDSQKARLVLDTINNFQGGTGIIYVGTRARADALLEILLESDIEAVSYHGGMEANERKWIQDNFMSGKVKVIIATNAFGLGIDKRDIRFVIHYDMPGTIEAYYQEAGRAGRDGKQSFCLMFYSSRDRHLQEFFIKGDNPPPEMIFEIYEILKNYESDSVLVTYAELGRMLSEQVPEMAIGTAIKILEKEGYVSRSREKTNNAYLKIKDIVAATNSFGPRAKAQKELWDKLLQKYEAELVNGWQVNFEEVAQILGFKKDALTRLVKKMTDANLAEYQPPFRGTEINILKRIDASEVNLDFSALKEKLRKAYKKLDSMEEYAYHFGCRQKFILKYFGDDELEDCGKCDNCLNGGMRVKAEVKYEYKSKADRFKPKERILETDEDLSEVAGLGTKLTQLETFDLYNKGMGIDEMAQIRNLKPATIVEHLCYLVEKKLPVEIDKFVNNKKKRAIEEVIGKIGKGKLAPIKEELGDDFSWDEIKLVLASCK